MPVWRLFAAHVKNDLHLPCLTFRDRLIAATEVQGLCALIQRPHLFIPLREATLPDYLARIVSRDGAVGVLISTRMRTMLTLELPKANT